MICPAFRATARSAMVVSSVSPDRWEMMAVYYCTKKAAAGGKMQAFAMATAVYCYYAKAYFGIS